MHVLSPSRRSTLRSGGEVYLTLKHIWRRHLNRHGPLHSQLVQEVIHARSPSGAGGVMGYDGVDGLQAEWDVA